MPPLTTPALFAEGRTEPFLQRPEDWVVVGSLAGALLLGAVAVWLVDRWRKRAARDDQRTGEELTSFRAMYERGEITEAEYARLRQRVADRVKARAAAAPAGGLPPAAGSSPPPPPAPPA